MGMDKRLLTAVLVAGLVSGCKPSGTVQGWGSTASDPARQEMCAIVVAFASNQFQKAQLVAQRLNMKMPYEFTEFYRAAMQGDMQVASQLYAEINLQVGGYEHSTSDRLRSPLLPTLMDTFAARDAADSWDPALLKEFARRIYAVIPSNGVYFGGTDAGRFVITAFQHALGRDDVAIVTQNGLADATYIEYLRQTVAPDHALYIPSMADFQHAFQVYIEDVERRKKAGEPIEEDVTVVDGKISIGGVSGVMRLNGILARMIFANNTNSHAFCIEESYVIAWMYPYLEPCGIILRLQPAPVTLSPSIIAADSKYWADLKATLGPALPRCPDAQKSFSKCRCAIAGVYEYHGLFAEAERTCRDAIELCPSSDEAHMRLLSLLMKTGRFDDAVHQAESYQRMDPTNERLEGMVEAIKAAQTAACGSTGTAATTAVVTNRVSGGKGP